jgi:antitoxin component YwqK of YwqJK toxin-antitoxin module
MKRFLAPILLLTLLVPTIAFGETMKDLVVRDGIHYKKFSDVPFTGKVTGKFLDWFVDGTIKNGQWVGPWVSYHDNGKLYEKVNYRDGKREGPWVWYHANGRLLQKGTYRDDKKHGPWVSYNLDGTIYQSLTGTYKNGVKVK